MSELLRTEKLSRRYRSKYALRDADLHIQKGDIYGLIGRNGAGKTTLLKLINSQIRATSGRIFMKGQPMAYGMPQLRLGALVESPGFYPDYSARDNLTFQALALGRREKGLVDRMLKLVELQDTGKKTAKQFSLGMKQRLGIALAMMNDPELLILDEPINGMDPQGIKDIRELLVRLNREEGVTILISSHILDELAKFATSYGIIKDGELIRQLTRTELDQGEQSFIEIASPELDRVLKALGEGLDITQVQRLDTQRLMVKERVADHETISRHLFDQGIYVSQFFVRHQSLEDYFMELTGGGIQ